MNIIVTNERTSQWNKLTFLQEFILKELEKHLLWLSHCFMCQEPTYDKVMLNQTVKKFFHLIDGLENKIEQPIRCLRWVMFVFQQSTQKLNKYARVKKCTYQSKSLLSLNLTLNVTYVYLYWLLVSLFLFMILTGEKNRGYHTCK